MDDINKNNDQKHDSEQRWMDLPQDILGLLLEKLHIGDQIRFRAVCKNWCLPKDLLRKCLPWMVSFQYYSPSLQIFDPQAQESHSIDLWPHYDPCDRSVFACKCGWLLRGYTQWDRQVLFLHNPFKNEVLELPFLDHMCCIAATFIGNPESPDCCEIVVLSTPLHANHVYINRYRLSSADTNWNTQYLETMGHCSSIHYMNGQIYWFAIKNRLAYTLSCYSLDHGSWSSEEHELPEQMVINCTRDTHWLTDICANLILVVCSHKYGITKFMVFSYDWSRMCWAEFTHMDGIAFFISDRSILSVPSNDWGCRVFYVDGNGEVYYYSLKEEKHIKADELYPPREGKEDNMKSYGQPECKKCFIEPAPYFQELEI